jgi:hypothetical protein
MPFPSVVLKSFLVVGRIFCRLVNVYLSSPSLVLSTPSINSHTLMPFRAGRFICNSIHELVPFLHVPRDFVAYQTFVKTLQHHGALHLRLHCLGSLRQHHRTSCFHLFNFLAFSTSMFHEKIETPGFLSPGLRIFGDLAYINNGFMMTQFKNVKSGAKDYFNFYHSQFPASYQHQVCFWDVCRSVGNPPESSAEVHGLIRTD